LSCRKDGNTGNGLYTRKDQDESNYQEYDGDDTGIHPAHFSSFMGVTSFQELFRNIKIFPVLIDAWKKYFGFRNLFNTEPDPRSVSKIWNWWFFAPVLCKKNE
jgi:hypothetical protein